MRHRCSVARKVMKQHEMTHLQCDTAQISLNEITVSWVGHAAPSAIEAQEQVPDGLAPSQREPTAAPMLWPIVQHVAPLAERLQVPRPVLGRIVVEVRAGQHWAAPTRYAEDLQAQPQTEPASRDLCLIASFVLLGSAIEIGSALVG